MTKGTWDYNWFYKFNAGATYTGANGGTTDPLFTNYASDDFSLTGTSPLKGTGHDLGSEFAFGIAPGATWPNPALLPRASWDIGAYVYCSGASCLPPGDGGAPSSDGGVAGDGGVVTDDGGAGVDDDGGASDGGASSDPGGGGGCSSSGDGHLGLGSCFAIMILALGVTTRRKQRGRYGRS